MPGGRCGYRAASFSPVGPSCEGSRELGPSDSGICRDWSSPVDGSTSFEDKCLFYVHVDEHVCACVCMHVCWVYVGAHRGQKKVVYTLEPELQLGASTWVHSVLANYF